MPTWMTPRRLAQNRSGKFFVLQGGNGKDISNFQFVKD